MATNTQKSGNFSQNNDKRQREEDQWYVWLAGLTDGDGCFYINKKEKSVSFEITTHTTDARVLYSVKNKLKAGSVLPRSGSVSVRYRVKTKAVIAELVNRLNGKLKNPVRVQQLLAVCALIGVQPTLPSDINKSKSASTSPYLAGIIDSDGTITIGVSRASAADSQISGVNGRITRLINSRGRNQLSLKVTSSFPEYAQLLCDMAGMGQVYQEKANKNNRSPNVKYHWTVAGEEDFKTLYELLKGFPLRSLKMHRLRLSLLYFKYKELGYHLAPPGTLKGKTWAKFARSWYKYSF